MKINFRGFVLWLGSLCVLPQAQAISKVGNARIGDEALGFTVAIPPYFSFERETHSGGAILNGQRRYFGGGPRTQHWGLAHLFVSTYAEAFPDLVGEDRDDLRARLESYDTIQWSRVRSEGCLDVYYARTDTADALFAVWGKSRGFLVSGARGGDSLDAIRSMRNTIELLEGACEWESSEHKDSEGVR